MSAYGDDMRCPFCSNFRKSKQSKTCGNRMCATKQREKTTLERHGVRNPSQCSKIKEQKRNTTLKNYGVDNPSQSDVVKGRKMTTARERYGVDHVTQLESKKEKSRVTNLKRYGYEHPLQSESVRDKGKISKLEKYGDENFNNRKQARSTNLHRYGVSHPMKDRDISTKASIAANETCLAKYGISHAELLAKSFKDKYGVDNPMHDVSIAKKCFDSRYQSKEYMFPSGNTVRVQGYENRALDILLNTYNENDILTNTTDVPRILYVGSDKKQHYYYPDIYIPCDNLIIEVKSTYTYEADLERNLLKEQATKDAGYMFKFIIL